MSILIKSIKMPKNCDICFIRDDCEYSMPLSKRPIDCPLVEVPEPHGRLIDADEILKENKYNGIMDVYKIAIAPTIIEAED